MIVFNDMYVCVCKKYSSLLITYIIIFSLCVGIHSIEIEITDY